MSDGDEPMTMTVDRKAAVNPRSNMKTIILLLPLALLPPSLSFQPLIPSRCDLTRTSPFVPSPRVSIRLAAADNPENEPDKKIPFFARVAKKILGKSNEGSSDDGEGTVATIDAGSPVETLNSVDNNDDDVERQANQMKALAERTRLEAQRDEMLLTLEKIAKLEQKASKSIDPKLRESISNDVKLLSSRLDPSIQNKVTKSTSKDTSTKTTIKPPENTTAKDEPPPLGKDKRQEAITGYTNLPPPIQEAIAKSIGLPKDTNATIVVDKLMAENRLTETNDTYAFQMTLNKQDLEEADIFVDPKFVQLNTLVSSLYPEVTRKQPLNEEYVKEFCAQVLGKDTFNPSGKPEAVPGGYIIRGTNRIRSKKDGTESDLLMEAIEKKLVESSVHKKLRCFYVLDPTPSRDEIDDEEDEPVLFLTNYDLSPSTDVWVKPVVSLIGLASVAAFSLGAFSMNMDVVDQVSKAAETGGDLGWLVDLSMPIGVGILGVQLAHEAGHLIVAVKDGISIGPPTLIPSASLGLTGTITPIKSPPKNIKSLFDFAVAGPLLGIIASLSLLYVGLEMTVYAPAIDKFPSVPASLLRSSTLASGIIEYLLGDGLLNTPDPANSFVKLHPYAIAGFVGLMSNALSLIPIGNTDGGRISLAFFGRSFALVVQGAAIVVLAFCGLFGADELGIFISYALFCQFFQRQAEIPCRNEVDELDFARGLVAIVMGVVVVLTLFPLST